MSNTITLRGHLGGDGDLRYTPSGAPVLGLSIPDTPRRKNDRGEWEDDGPTAWYRASLWGVMAEAMAEHAVKGAPITVTGTLRPREYEHGGQTRTSLDVTVDTIKIDAPR